MNKISKSAILFPVFHALGKKRKGGKHKLVVLIILIFYKGTFAQKKVTELDLETCINKAVTENIDLKTATNNTLFYTYEYKKSWANVLPQVNANWNMNKIYGTVFDQVSFQRITKATTTSFPSVNASIVLFDGLNGYAAQQQAKAQLKTAEYTKLYQEQQLMLNVSDTYFQCLKYSKTLEVYKSRIKALQTLNKATKIQVEKGDRQLMELYAVESQLETEKAAYLETQTLYTSGLNTLLTLMRTEIKDSVVLKESGLEFSSATTISTEELVKSNLSILTKEMEFKTSQYTKKRTFSGFLPTVSLTGTLASSYSSNGIFDFSMGTVLYPTYSEQLNLNFYQVVGLNVSIPIFNRMSNYYNVRQQTIVTENKKLELEKEKLVVQNQLSTYLDNQKTIAQKQIALEKASAAANEAYKAGEIQYNKGDGTFYDVLNSLNKKNQAEIDVWQNKVDAWMVQKRILSLIGK
ncbi:MAG TPA: TolC family protein [Flavobacteriales bacterium]|nr:TolC family protein [Flavobacteriales bacterium]